MNTDMLWYNHVTLYSGRSVEGEICQAGEKNSDWSGGATSAGPALQRRMRFYWLNLALPVCGGDSKIRRWGPSGISKLVGEQ